MRLTWDKDSDAYTAVENEIFKRYSCYGSFIVQIREKHMEEEKWYEATELLLNEGYDNEHPHYIWENDWWEGEQFVELVAVAPVFNVKLADEWRI